MSKQLGNPIVRLILGLKQWLSRGRRELITASVVLVCVLILRSIGLLQSVELSALDQFFRLRPNEQPDNRITIVAIDEASLHKGFPIPDGIIANLLKKLQANQPRVIGLDIYRDLPTKDGHENLVDTYKTIPNLVGTQLLSNDKSYKVAPPPQLNSQQIGFNNLLYDPDGKVRRILLYWHIGENYYESFALKLALLYLKSEKVFPRKAANNPEYLQLGKSVFPRFEQNDGAYVRADDKGTQILSNFPKPGCRNSSLDSCGFQKVSMLDVLDDKVPRSWIEDRIVLIGSTAPSLQDFVFIPYSSRWMRAAKPVAGIELQAYFISQLISAALEGRPVLKVWSDFWEYLWIFAWSYLGAVAAWRIRGKIPNIVAIFVACCLLFLSAYLAFLSGWWIPLVPALLTLVGSVIWMINYLAHMQEELKRSKEFLQQVIDTIADPIFVKNEQHQWIVLNKAYCRFIGYPESFLVEKSDVDFFPKHEADVFRQQDELVFDTQKPQENEEEFTDAYGKTHLIATKRSLHKDAAGNLFLVGVIRDITQRKLMEEELKRTAAELFRSNNELKLKEDHLRYLAYHDALTGLPNRKYFAEQLYESINWAKDNNFSLGLLFIDLDGFKQVNDSLGHEMGDRLLVVIAQRLSNSLRASDTVARLGGDEFTVILQAIPNVQVAAKVAEKILANITEPIVLNGCTTKVSVSIGISIYPETSLDPDTLLKKADAAMYRAKHLGKNRFELADRGNTES
ncbi:Putative diguanylate cyclase (GGDEF domain) with PAS/PAC and Chase2 sensors [Trichormus variabilis ATCC 29413]|uniref:Diguanylate cyclase (GGDEF domain) with PAS/PAC and Chase2 sensors n=2 Tax=Anabaena variabilis TaxID=264691 RepID=Q3MFH4_TRIV2|nr:MULTISPECIES: CHASE2 domain-containing protein [Nostocaceae]ABA20262.1 Putative diguanylate cyclase (GGDEF domain) with PAS/PAC and Chase2 sensors [Trichormus variabilis ATCC 29413]MBC1212761.1 CHASE2 domain-containing protein [Trichormus variabilis ARAD]MBC1256546.1 CHASE2 domain-containing protein [Trichormus variabilis V5]MBC1269050.1 CHASE2 domain-containing protein [Trichormus variabilis FSR]MBC1304161.1 CHASE2 domain-containing protein [Trichormus variabilis N2B]